MTSSPNLVVAHVKCVDEGRSDEWSEWYDTVHLPELLDGGDLQTVATRWVLADPPEPGRSGLGFSHVTTFELGGAGASEELERRATRLRAEGRVHPAHCVTAASSWRTHGRWTEMSPVRARRSGLILAEVMPADPGSEEEWDRWYDEQHVPDMLATGVFAAATRWERTPRLAFGTNHLTAYEVEGIDVGAAVESSAAALPDIVERGRRFPGHTGVLTLVLVPTGSHGAAGYGPTD